MIVNQPHDKQLGIQLIEAMDSNKYTRLTIMVAYAKLSGVYRLLPYIRKFHDAGGEVRFIIGIDQQNTTYDALLQLSKVADKISIFHSESMAQTFHIKCYWLESNELCWYAIGSNNLTAGGLFSNYELCTTNYVNGAKANSTNQELEGLYKIYSNPDSACTHNVDDAFLKDLLDNKYVVKEIQQRKELVEAAKKTRLTSFKNKLFGNEVFPAPQLPKEYRNATIGRTPKQELPKSTHKPIQHPEPFSSERYKNNYLIRLVPKAGNRSKQVHFTIDILENFFCLKPGDSILVQEMFPSGKVGEIEPRQIVFSQRNRNVKIELSGAANLNTNYPANTEKRPVLILKRVNPNLFVYMILMEGNAGYLSINNRLKNQSAGRSLPYEVIDESTMFSLWNDCPIM